jgi:hypothetical protein
VHVLRGAAVSYALVLASCRLLIALPWQPSGGYPLPVANVFITLVAPVLLLADWVLVGDRRPLSHSYLRWVAAYPVLWSAITLLRGVDTGWSPYPLLNPATAGIRLPLYLAGTGLVAFAGGAIASWISRRRALLPMDPAAQAVEAVAAPVLEVAPLEPPTPVDSPPVALPSAAEPAEALEALRLVEPPPAEESGPGGPPPL